jgi:hypothetical protein
MNKNYLPALVVFAKGMTIIALGVVLQLMGKKMPFSLYGIGGVVVFISVLVWVIMLKKKKVNRDESIF